MDIRTVLLCRAVRLPPEGTDRSRGLKGKGPQPFPAPLA